MQLIGFSGMHVDCGLRLGRGPYLEAFVPIMKWASLLVSCSAFYCPRRLKLWCGQYHTQKYSFKTKGIMLGSSLVGNKFSSLSLSAVALGFKMLCSRHGNTSHSLLK